MKKTIQVIAVILVMTIVFGGCGAKEESSNVSIDQFEKNVIQKIEDNGTLKTEEADNGYSFSFTSEDGNLSFTGEAGKNKMIKSVTALGNELDAGFFMEMTAQDIINLVTIDKYYEKLTMRKVMADQFVLYTAYEVALFSPDNSEKDTVLPGMDTVLAIRNGSQTINGWKYTITPHKDSNSVEMKVEFVGGSN